jgi:pimeloyl-ACP methyl ester carboxylesterase/class 3 adenylate cyclase
MLGETRYARSGDVHIAYQVHGDGPFDVVLVPGALSHVELSWRVSAIAAFDCGLASFCRLVRFDKRGTGMSDRVAGAPSLETRIDDVRAVMDAVGSERAALFGVSEGGAMSVLFAATHPERVWGLVLFGTFARERWAPDYPWGFRDEDYSREAQEDERGWGSSEHSLALARALAPSIGEADQEEFAALIRQSASPGAVAALGEMNRQIDVRDILPSVRVPTLVMHRERDDDFIKQGSRHLAEHIPAARFLQLPGSDHVPFGGETEPLLAETRAFLETVWAERAWDEEPDRVVATVLFTDIVSSTVRAVELGDRRWRELLGRHHDLVRRQLIRHRGTEIDTAGDGFFASFDGPARAIRCAESIIDGVRELGIEIRTGLHAGECEVIDGKIGGIAVHIGARIASQAAPCQILVSGTVRDLVAGSGIEFDDHGTTQLKGIPGDSHIYAVRQVLV